MDLKMIIKKARESKYKTIKVLGGNDKKKK
jgi:hypothetical protein